VKKNEQLTLADYATKLNTVLPNKKRHSEEELDLLAKSVTSSLIRHRLIHRTNHVWVDTGSHDLGFNRYSDVEDRYVSTWMQAAVVYHGEASVVGLNELVRPRYLPIIGVGILPEETFFVTECQLGYSAGFLVPDGHELKFGSRTLLQ